MTTVEKRGIVKENTLLVISLYCTSQLKWMCNRGRGWRQHQTWHNGRTNQAASLLYQIHGITSFCPCLGRWSSVNRKCRLRLALERVNWPNGHLMDFSTESGVRLPASRFNAACGPFIWCNKNACTYTQTSLNWNGSLRNKDLFLQPILSMPVCLWKKVVRFTMNNHAVPHWKLIQHACCIGS